MGKRLLFTGVLFGVLVVAGCGGVTCDRFNLNAELQGNQLTMSLDTDLPDDTVVTVLVSRVYRLTGENRRMPVAYVVFGGQTVGDWRTPQTTTLDHDEWRRRAARKGEIGSIEPNISVSCLVWKQYTPEFGEDNRKLSGSQVKMGTGGKANTVYKEVVLNCPLP